VRHSGKIDFIGAGDDDHGKDESMAVFPDRDASMAYARQSEFLQAVPYQIVELDQL
jgi:hypothetical protein